MGVTLMPALNRVLLIGNLTRDPVLKQLPSNSALVEFGLAVNRKFKSAAGEDKEDTCFVDCTAFGKQAETINQYCRKGRPLFVEGRLKFDTWDDRAGLGRRSKVSVVVENFQFLGGRDEADADMNKGDGSPASHTPQGSEPSPRPRRQAAEKPFGEELAFQEADIPF